MMVRSGRSTRKTRSVRKAPSRVRARARARARARLALGLVLGLGLARVTCVDIGALSDDLVRVRGSG